jgi:hypothetical protein
VPADPVEWLWCPSAAAGYVHWEKIAGLIMHDDEVGLKLGLVLLAPVSYDLRMASVASVVLAAIVDSSQSDAIAFHVTSRTSQPAHHHCSGSSLSLSFRLHRALTVHMILSTDLSCTNRV